MRRPTTRSDHKNHRPTSWIRAVRWGFGVSLIGLPIPLLGEGGEVAAAAPLLMLLGGALLAPDVASFIHRWAEELRLAGQPPPIYGIAETLVAKGRYAEAEEEYEKIIRAFPNEVKPHTDMIHLAVRWLNNGELAEKLYQRGLSLLRNPEDRQILSEAYERIRTRLKTAESDKPRIISSEKLDEARARAKETRERL
jgi:tetratricopeptide (TPR) repeat protein